MRLNRVTIHHRGRVADLRNLRVPDGVKDLAGEGRPGSFAYNALAEGFFGMLKRERANRRRYRTRAEARTDIFDYIERFYNPRMRHGLQKLEQSEITLDSTVRTRPALRPSEPW